jgi:uncharacterized membrane protein|tara:strand:- start:3309 stop:3929 length:621 start_codon:yes stop_codon:yes gene_type:complete
MLAKIKNYFLTGVLVSAPVFITFWIVFSLVELFDKLITPLIPYYINPNYYLPRDVPGLGLITLVILLVGIGFITASFFGSYIFKKTESVINRIPFIKIFYKTTKQIIETIFKNNSQAFRDVVLLEYPRKGLWVLGFTTGEVKGAVSSKIKGELVNVFVPTTPNPTSGFLLMVPKSQLKYLNTKVDDAVKTIISAGIIELNSKQKNS